jgi:hypothetical protein
LDRVEHSERLVPVGKSLCPYGEDTLSKSRRLLGVSALIGAAFLLTPASLSLAQGDSKVEPAVQAPRAATAALGTSINDAAAAAKNRTGRSTSVGVSADLKAMADKAMAADPSLSALLQGVPYTVTKEGPWTRVKSETRIGVVREIKLGRTLDAPLRPWPVIVWDESADTYQRHLYNASYKGVTRVTVFVDDAAGVVQLSPGPEATVVEGPGNEWKESLPAGGAD